MKLSLGPVLFYWNREKLLDFYAEMAEQPLDVMFKRAKDDYEAFLRIVAGQSTLEHKRDFDTHAPLALPPLACGMLLAPIFR